MHLGWTWFGWSCNARMQVFKNFVGIVIAFNCVVYTLPYTKRKCHVKVYMQWFKMSTS